MASWSHSGPGPDARSILTVTPRPRPAISIKRRCSPSFPVTHSQSQRTGTDHFSAARRAGPRRHCKNTHTHSMIRPSTLTLTPRLRHDKLKLHLDDTTCEPCIHLHPHLLLSIRQAPDQAAKPHALHSGTVKLSPISVFFRWIFTQHPSTLPMYKKSGSGSKNCCTSSSPHRCALAHPA